MDSLQKKLNGTNLWRKVEQRNTEPGDSIAISNEARMRRQVAVECTKFPTLFIISNKPAAILKCCDLIRHDLEMNGQQREVNLRSTDEASRSQNQGIPKRPKNNGKSTSAQQNQKG